MSERVRATETANNDDSPFMAVVINGGSHSLSDGEVTRTCGITVSNSQDLCEFRVAIPEACLMRINSASVQPVSVCGVPNEPLKWQSQRC